MAGGGWMTTKKVGRDDKRIAADKKKAENDRRAKRGLKAKGKGKSKSKATTGNKKKRAPPRRKRQPESEEESEYEEEEEPWEVESEEEEDVELPYEESSDEDDDDDEDEGGSSFLQKSTRKNPRIKEPMLQTAAKARKKKRNGGYAAAPPSKKKVTSSSDDEVSEDGANFGDDDDDDDGLFSRFKHKPTAAARNNKKKQQQPQRTRNNMDLSSDSEVEEVPAPKKKNAARTSKYFATKQPNKVSLSLEEEDEEDDTPVKSKSKAKSASKKKRAINVEEDDDEDAANRFEDKKAPRNSIGDSSWQPEEGQNNTEDEEDEDLRLAMKASMKSAKKEEKKRGKLRKLGVKNNKKKEKHKKLKLHPNDSPSSAIVLADSDEEQRDNKEGQDEEEEKGRHVDMSFDSSDDDDDGPDDDDHDEYMDEDEREASQVLAAANDLSASVMRIMTSWASDLRGDDEGDEASSDKKKMAIPQGIIVDGAIAMTSMRKNPLRSSLTGNNSQHAWISNEVMKEVLPTVTLAEYQLLGVNWLAMLHSMTCKVAHRKGAKATNVNGILADEMGLGKTCQTISFLAWLKHSRSKGDIKEVGEGVAKKGDDISDDDVSDAEGDDGAEAIDVDAKPSATANPTKTKHAEISMRTSAEEKSQDSLPHLIIVPASVVSNWEREFQNFAPHMSVLKYYGTQEERLELKRRLRDYLPKSRKKDVPMIDVILAPITYFQKESSEDRDFLRKFNFDYLICDEGHLLKNAKGLRYRNIDRFRTRHRLLLTGTPIQNSPQELMALLCFLMPLFKKRGSNFDDDNDDGGESMLQHFVNLEGAQSNQETSHEVAYRKLKQLFAPFVLRRKKKDVLSQIIPPKTYEVEFVDLQPVAREQYYSIISAHLKAKRNKTKSATEHLFTALRKAAHHPHLLRTRHNTPAEIEHLTTYFLQYGAFKGEGATKEKVAKELEGYSDFDLHLMALELCDERPLRREELERYMLTEEDLFASAKLARLRTILPKLIEEGHRILIFSVWTTCLDLISCMLEHMGVKCMRMDGQTAVSDRQEDIDKFNNDDSIPVFLLSTNACGMGINLTSADTCIMHDISVNPFVDLQAEDRCHRIGQKKPVKIIKLVAKDTVDSDIYDMQERKVKMNAAIMETPWSNKDEKKEKNLIMKNIVERHSEPNGKDGSAGNVTGKENQAVNGRNPSDETEI